jgi:hypothetical protein
MSYDRQDMIYYNDYQWSHNQPQVAVQETSKFDSRNGNIILYLINLLSVNIFESNILEIIIHEYIPNTVNTINQAIEWIREKGDFYYQKVVHSLASGE